MNQPKMEFEVSNTNDAEIQLIEIVPKILNHCALERKIAVLEYILKRYQDGDNFGY